jgi:hypothetical protein
MGTVMISIWNVVFSRIFHGGEKFSPFSSNFFFPYECSSPQMLVTKYSHGYNTSGTPPPPGLSATPLRFTLPMFLMIMPIFQHPVCNDYSRRSYGCLTNRSGVIPHIMAIPFIKGISEELTHIGNRYNTRA